MTERFCTAITGCFLYRCDNVVSNAFSRAVCTRSTTSFVPKCLFQHLSNSVCFFLNPFFDEHRVQLKLFLSSRIAASKYFLCRCSYGLKCLLHGDVNKTKSLICTLLSFSARCAGDPLGERSLTALTLFGKNLFLHATTQKPAVPSCA